MSSIKPKLATCRGTGKAKGFGCGQKVYRFRYGLGKSCGCWIHFLLSDSGSEVLHRESVKASKIEQKKKREKKREVKKKITNWKNELQSEVQKIARYIDHGLPCLALGNYTGQMHGGHVYSKGGHTSIRFNLHNIHRQSAASNLYRSDDALFREKLVEEYGAEYLNFLQEIQKAPQMKWVNMDYHNFTRVARRIVREFELIEKRPISDRIEIRNELNLEMGIYPESVCIFKL